jgi:hypothetical protein
MYYQDDAGNVAWRKKDGIWDHPAIIMPGGWGYENQPGRGESLVPLTDFVSKAKGEVVVQRFPVEKRQRHIARVRSELATPRAWHPLNNCQDTVNRIIEGRPRSHQRDAIVLVSVLVLLIAAIASR